MSSSEPSTDKKEVAPTAPAAAADDSKAVAESKAEVIKEAQSGTPANASTGTSRDHPPTASSHSHLASIIHPIALARRNLMPTKRVARTSPNSP